MRLSSLLLPEEARVFDVLSDSISKMQPHTILWNDDRPVIKELEATLRALMQDDTLTLHVKGSQAKGTQTNLSDIDIIIDTPGRCVSRSEKQEVRKCVPHQHRTS